MKKMFKRTVPSLVALLIAVFLAAPAISQTPATTQDPKAAAKAAAEAKKQAELDKKAAEKKAKEDEKLAKDAAKKAAGMKNADIENIGNRDINKGGMFGNLMKWSLEDEIAIGRQASKELEASVTLVQDPVIREYVNRVGQNIVRNSDAKVPFTIKVIESDEINAVSLPGGFFYVNTGLILAADEEAELAGVMAHEIAHVTSRHAAEQQQKGSLVNIASIPAMIFGGGISGMIIQQAASVAVPLMFVQFSQKAETEADWLGLQYMYAAGYDPGASVSFFEKLQARESAKKKVSSLFSTHPQTEQRVAMTKSNIEAHLQPKEQYLVTTSEFSKIKTLLARLENQRTPNVKERAPSLRVPRRQTGRDDDSGEGDKDGTAKPGETSSDSDAPPVLRRPQDRPQ
jgi:Zn-dependent protease with chaperone function